MGITRDIFNIFVGKVKEALEEVGVREDHIKHILDNFETLSGFVIKM